MIWRSDCGFIADGEALNYFKSHIEALYPGYKEKYELWCDHNKKFVKTEEAINDMFRTESTLCIYARTMMCRQNDAAWTIFTEDSLKDVI